VAAPGVVHGEDEAIRAGQLIGQGVRQVRREGGDAAAARQVVAEHGEAPDRGGGVGLLQDPSVRRGKGGGCSTEDSRPRAFRASVWTAYTEFSLAEARACPERATRDEGSKGEVAERLKAAVC
jgi:hypothetical protein